MNVSMANVAKMAKGCKIISISEVTHYSRNSHDFQFELFKHLAAKKLINTFTSEILTNMDAYLINRWLKGEIHCSLKRLFERALPMGGIGTYRCIEYIRKHKLPIKVIPAERDYEITFQYKKDFHKYVDFGDPKVVEYLKVAKSNVDRTKYWYKNLAANCTSRTRLYIIGYHLNRNMSQSIPLHRIGKTLHVGLASGKMDMMTYNVDISPAKYAAYVKPFMLQPKEIPGKRVDISDANKYLWQTELEKEYEGKYQFLDTRKSSGAIKHIGANILPVNDKIPLAIRKSITKKYYLSDIKIYDCVVFIPQSAIRDYRLYY